MRKNFTTLLWKFGLSDSIFIYFLFLARMNSCCCIFRKIFDETRIESDVSNDMRHFNHRCSLEFLFVIFLEENWFHRSWNSSIFFPVNVCFTNIQFPTERKIENARISLYMDIIKDFRMSLLREQKYLYLLFHKNYGISDFSDKSFWILLIM